MKTIAISEFKARCIAVLKDAQSSGESVLVTRRGAPIARIEPVPSQEHRPLGVYRGRMQIADDLVYTDSSGDWEMLD